MKAYCGNCESLQPSSFRLGHDAVTSEPYEDLCCNTCHFIVATVQGRENVTQPVQEPDENALRLQFTGFRYSTGNSINSRRHDNGKFVSDVEKEYQAWKQQRISLPVQEPPEWAGIKAILDEYGLQAIDFVADFKAALEQPVQEPVGKVVEAVEGAFRCEFTVPLPAGTKLYTTPPKREWVGLTYEDWKKIEDMPDAFDQGVAWAQAKLKEKNT